MIVKIQRPLMTTGEPMALVYNEDRSFEAEMPYTQEIAGLFVDGSLKVYHKATFMDDTLMIGVRVPSPGHW